MALSSFEVSWVAAQLHSCFTCGIKDNFCVLYTCFVHLFVHLFCTLVLCTCFVRLFCTLVLYTCCVHLFCTLVVYTCCVHLFCTLVLCSDLGKKWGACAHKISIDFEFSENRSVENQDKIYEYEELNIVSWRVLQQTPPKRY